MSDTEIARNFARFGCHHIACGRVLHHRRASAAPWLEQKMRGVARPIDPVRHIVEGARAYASSRGLTDPHRDVDYHGITQSADRIHHLAREYDRLPLFDHKAVPHFQAMRDEVNHQFDHLTNRMGIKAEFVDHDPYANAHEMAADLRDNKRIKVLRTASTGSHPFFSDEENDRFRAVHDAFGHAGTGRDFDGHGEEAAFHAHARMFSPTARGALASETRGQNGSVIMHDSFGPQKIALMPNHLWTPEGMHHAAATDWDEFRRVQDGQHRRYETPGNAGSKEDRDRFFGLGEHGGGQERLVTPRDWIQHSRGQSLDDIDPAFKEHWRGFEMGHGHAQSGGIDQRALIHAHGRSPHPDDFIEGYHSGLASGFGEDDMHPQRVAVMLDKGKPNGYFMAESDWPSKMIRTAHVSGNQIDVLHCPFCGSGAVVARSDGSIQCTFCDAAFTVTVSPMFNAFPQSVGGDPYPWPGRPGGGMDPSQMMMGDAPGGGLGDGGSGYGGGLVPGGGDGGDDEGDDDNPFASNGDDSDDDGDDKEAEIGGKKQPPFTKKKSSLYTTAVGGRVQREDYLRHLAIETAHDRDAVIAKVRRSR